MERTNVCELWPRGEDRRQRRCLNQNGASIKNVASLNTGEDKNRFELLIIVININYWISSPSDTECRAASFREETPLLCISSPSLHQSAFISISFYDSIFKFAVLPSCFLFIQQDWSCSGTDVLMWLANMWSWIPSGTSFCSMCIKPTCRGFFSLRLS